MPNLEARFIRCLQAVFPKVSADKASTLHPGAIETWDSVATVTLFAVIEEEFGVTIDIDDLESDISAPAILRFLQRSDLGNPRREE